MDPVKPELVSLEREIRCRYAWSTGKTVGAFLEALRDRRAILGSQCDGCGSVSVPPGSYCERCGSEMRDWKEVGPRGVVTSWTRAGEEVPGLDVPAPFRYVLVRLAGADTSMLHLAPDDDRVQVGATLVAEFRTERSGAVTDIRWFVPEESAEV